MIMVDNQRSFEELARQMLTKNNAFITSKRLDGRLSIAREIRADVEYGSEEFFKKGSLVVQESELIPLVHLCLSALEKIGIDRLPEKDRELFKKLQAARQAA